MGRRAAGVVLAALAAGCSHPPDVFERPGVQRLLEVRTYEGSGQVVHPDVIRGGPDGSLWMALTPYPDSREKYENPSVYRSRDGFQWAEPARLVNPVVPRPPVDHNSDPDIVFAAGRFHLFYLESQRREFVSVNEAGRRAGVTLDWNLQRLRVLRSADGIDWSDPETVIEWQLDSEPFWLSPAVVRVGDRWRLYLVDRASGVIAWSEADSPRGFGPPGGILETGLDGVRPWHLDVFPVEGGWAALVCGIRSEDAELRDTALWIGASADLGRWTFRPSPLLDAARDTLGVTHVYRSTGLTERGVLAVWYSGRDPEGKWRIGVHTFDAAVVAELLR